MLSAPGIGRSLRTRDGPRGELRPSFPAEARSAQGCPHHSIHIDYRSDSTHPAHTNPFDEKLAAPWAPGAAAVGVMNVACVNIVQPL